MVQLKKALCKLNQCSEYRPSKIARSFNISECDVQKQRQAGVCESLMPLFYSPGPLSHLQIFWVIVKGFNMYDALSGRIATIDIKSTLSPNSIFIPLHSSTGNR